MQRACPRRSVAGAVAALLSVAAAGGCGGDADDEGEPGSTTGADAELTALLPSDSDTVVYSDFAAAREQLGLQPDADVTSPTSEELAGTPALSALGVGLTLPWLFGPTGGPLVAAFDGGLIQAAATTNDNAADQTVDVLRTQQSFDEIATSLESDGYRAEGDVLVDRGLAEDVRAQRSGSTLAYPVVADAGGGIVVLGKSVEDVSAALDQAEGPAVSSALGGVDGALRAAHSYDQGCVRAVVVGVQLQPLAGELVIQLDGTPDSANVELADEPAASGVTAGTPVVEGSELHIDLEIDPVLGNPTVLASTGTEAASFYSC